jgi:type IV secretory pathway TrbF-like protein
MAADVSVCPHCEFDRMRNPERGSRRHHAARTPLRAVVVIVLALLAIGGYVYLSEPALDAPLFTSR